MADNSNTKHEEYIKAHERLAELVAPLAGAVELFVKAGRSSQAFINYLRPHLNNILEAHGNLPEHPSKEQAEKVTPKQPVISTLENTTPRPQSPLPLVPSSTTSEPHTETSAPTPTQKLQSPSDPALESPQDKKVQP